MKKIKQGKTISKRYEGLFGHRGQRRPLFERNLGEKESEPHTNGGERRSRGSISHVDRMSLETRASSFSACK